MLSNLEDGFRRDGKKETTDVAELSLLDQCPVLRMVKMLLLVTAVVCSSQVSH